MEQNTQLRPEHATKSTRRLQETSAWQRSKAKLAARLTPACEMISGKMQEQRQTIVRVISRPFATRLGYLACIDLVAKTVARLTENLKENMQVSLT